MKHTIIQLCDTVLYLILTVIVIGGLIALSASPSPMTIGIVILCLLGWAFASGFWFVASACYDELRKMNQRAGA